MPTAFWVTCPSLDKAIARVESSGGVRAAQEAVGEETIEEIHSEHLARYGTRAAGVRGEAGGHVKCLHAFTALHLSGAIPNPVAEWTLERLGNPYPEHACCTKPTKRRLSSSSCENLPPFHLYPDTLYVARNASGLATKKPGLPLRIPRPALFTTALAMTEAAYVEAKRRREL
jgi:hypothetical protein